MTQHPLEHSHLPSEVNKISFDPELAKKSNNIDGNEIKAVQGDGNVVALGKHSSINTTINNSTTNNIFIKTDDGEFNRNSSISSIKFESQTTENGRLTLKLELDYSKIDVNNLESLEILFSKKTEDITLKIINAKKGSLEITIEAGFETLELLKSLLESGELTEELIEVLGTSVKGIQIINKGLSEKRSNIGIYQNPSNQTYQEQIEEDSQFKYLRDKKVATLDRVTSSYVDSVDEKRETFNPNAIVESRISSNPLVGKALLQKVRELSHLTKREVARMSGYVKTSPSGAIRTDLSGFYDAVLSAKGVKLDETNRDSGGKVATYKATVHKNGQLLIGSAYAKQMGLKEGDTFTIKLGYKHIHLIQDD